MNIVIIHILNIFGEHMGKPSKNFTKVCKCCGESFHPKSSRQQCCNREINGFCAYCGNVMPKICSIFPQKETCSTKCQAALIKQRRELSASKIVKICKYCGKEFTPKSVNDLYCGGPHYTNCEVCGKSFVIVGRIDLHNKTCSDECRYISAKRNTDMEHMIQAMQATLQNKYGVSNIMELPETAKKIKEANLSKYGAEYYTQTKEYKDKARQTSLGKYGVEHHLKSPQVIEKRQQTCLNKYGNQNVLASDYEKSAIRDTLQAKYGVSNPSQHAEFKAKATKSAKTSKLEFRIATLLSQYNIEYLSHYYTSKDGLSHEFDFYLPKYKILIDADGAYFHSYLSDPDGVRVRDDYDVVRMKLIPTDHIFHLIIEGHEDAGIKQLVDIIKQLDSGVFEYESQLFRWCRGTEFPYPSYPMGRMLKDYKSLVNYTRLDNYNPNSRLGESIIRHHHESIYSAHVGNKPSPLEGWYDDTILKKVIANRLIYVNTVEPSKILKGLYISKLAPRVSIFNPVLAKYLTNKYLSAFTTVFDPFSGYSGRLLGVSSLGKAYIGQDLNIKVVDESNQIIQSLGLTNALVTTKDILGSYGEYDCLLTCPPYSNKEIYNSETIFKSCDAWISECLQRFKCNRYVFVVDHTESYSNYVVESIFTKSHLNNVSEYVIVIDR